MNTCSPLERFEYATGDVHSVAAALSKLQTKVEPLMFESSVKVIVVWFVKAPAGVAPARMVVGVGLLQGLLLTLSGSWKFEAASGFQPRVSMSW